MISLLGTHCASLFQQNPGPTKRERDRKKNIRLSQWRMRMMRGRRHNGSSNLDGLDLPVSLGCVSTLLCKQNTHVPMSTFSYTSVDIIGRPYFLCAASYRKREIYIYILPFPFGSVQPRGPRYTGFHIGRLSGRCVIDWPSISRLPSRLRCSPPPPITLFFHHRTRFSSISLSLAAAVPSIIDDPLYSFDLLLLLGYWV